LDKHLNIIAFDNPYPPIYGGVIDVYYKINELAKLGIKIHLHYFSKKNDFPQKLNEICEEIFIYKRKTGISQQFSICPYIVQSRSVEDLKTNLKKNNYPILFEGIHTTKFILEDLSIKNRSIIRHHNIEHDYYFGLYKSEKNMLHSIYYLIESFKLKWYLKKVKNAAFHLTISDADAQKLASLKFENIITIPPFHSSATEDTINAIQETPPYVLYHGNLNVAENIAAVDYLIKYVFTDSSINYIIAGSSNGHKLKNNSKANIKFIENPNQDEITNLIANARVITLPTFQSTGIKLKLIDSLYKGKHVIVNQTMIDGFPLPELTLLAKNSDEMKNLINVNLHCEFTSEDKYNRIQKLNLHFDNKTNAERINEVIENVSR
jgi:uncharacterized protein YihD (DUF1040 family)